MKLSARVPNRWVLLPFCLLALILFSGGAISGAAALDFAVANWHDLLVVTPFPADNASGVQPDTAITITWNQAMPTNTDFLVEGPAGVVPGALSYDDVAQTVTFTPANTLALASTYTVIISSNADAVDDVQPAPLVFTRDREGDAGAFCPPAVRGAT